MNIAAWIRFAVSWPVNKHRGSGMTGFVWMTLGRGLGICLVFLALGCGMALRAGAQNLLDHDQAIQALVDVEPSQRLTGMLRLADIGTAADANAVLVLLRDADPRLRQLALPLVWELWGRSGDAAIDAQYQQAMASMQAGELPKAVQQFTAIITSRPAFAEAWNKRATLYFMQGQYELSMKDCEEVLTRIPLHFGALSGYAQMLAERGQPERALQYLQRAYRVNPNMVNASLMIEDLRRQIEIRRKQTT